MSSHYDETVKKLGLSDTHQHLLNQIPSKSAVLELGPSAGYMTKVLAEKGCTVDAIELNEEDAKKAAAYCRKIVIGSIENSESFAKLTGLYDIVLAADVLEHLRSPENTLQQIRKLIGPNSLVLVSLPNVAHWRVRLSLLFGRFDYTDVGILDRTHLCFFTLKTAKEMFSSLGFKIEQVVTITFSGRSAAVLLKNLLRKFLPTLFSTGFVFHLRKI